MTNFKDSIEAGLKVARDGRNNREEISRILEDLNRDLLEMTNKSVGIDIETFSEDAPVAAALKALSSHYGAPSTYQAIVIINNTSLAKKKVAKWRQHINGYPCTITFGDSELSCHDAEALTAALAELVASPSVGRIILSYMDPISGD